MKWITELFARRRYLTLDEAIAAFVASPAQWFSYRGDPYIWPQCPPGMEGDIYFDNIRVLVDGHGLAFIEGLHIRGRTAYIGHIAVEKRLMRRGIGTALVHGVGLELADRYGVNRIVFAETHSGFHELGYPEFFAHIGAQPLAVDHPGQIPDRPDYEWLLANRDGWGG